jgi:hypothetical protein
LLIEALNENRPDKLQLLLQYGIDLEDINDPIMGMGYMDTFKWYERRSLSPPSSEEFMIYVLERGDLEVIQWLTELGIWPSRTALDHAAAPGYLDVLEWYSQYPTRRGARWTLEEENYETAEWLASQGIYP